MWQNICKSFYIDTDNYVEDNDLLFITSDDIYKKMMKIMIKKWAIGKLNWFKYAIKKGG